MGILGNCTSLEFSQEKLMQQGQCVMCLYQWHSKNASQYRYKYQNVYSNARLMQRNRSRTQLWRPWLEKSKSENSMPKKEEPFTRSQVGFDVTQAPLQFQHPVKLVWPKKPYDYMYSEGEQLLKDFPVQATLEFATDSDSEDEDDYDDECEQETEKDRLKETQD